MKRVLYCGSGPTVPVSHWIGAKQPDGTSSLPWPQLQNRRVIGTFRGRTAIALACNLLGIGSGDEVLVPAYNCGTETDAILAAGAGLVAYAVSRECKIEFADLISRRTSRTKAVYVIHYFGWEQPLEQLRTWCTQEGLFLIEDCALALFSQGPSGLIGRVGDAAIYSLPKSLGLCHGGLLSLSTLQAAELPHLNSPGSGVLKKEMRRSVQGVFSSTLERIGLYGSFLSARRRMRGTKSLLDLDGEFPAMPAEYNFNPGLDSNRANHSALERWASQCSVQEIIRRRRLNYQRLVGALTGIRGVRPLFESLPKGVCPLSLPLLVSNRDGCVSSLQARGIGALPWWAGFHQKSIDWSQFPDACWLKRQVLTLPIHQGLDASHIDYVAETAVQILRSAGVS